MRAFGTAAPVGSTTLPDMFVCCAPANICKASSAIAILHISNIQSCRFLLLQSSCMGRKVSYSSAPATIVLRLSGDPDEKISRSCRSDFSLSCALYLRCQRADRATSHSRKRCHRKRPEAALFDRRQRTCADSAARLHANLAHVAAVDPTAGGEVYRHRTRPARHRRFRDPEDRG